MYKTSVANVLTEFYIKISEESLHPRKSYQFSEPPMRMEFGKANNFYQTIKMWNTLFKYINSAESMQHFGIKLRELLIRCREIEFVYTDNRIINVFAVRDMFRATPTNQQ